MKLLKGLIAIAVVFGLFVWAIGSYLGPDDLAKCKGLEPSAATGCEKADAIVAVSGGDTVARTTEAILLYKNGWASTIIFSGAAADKSGPSNAQVMKQQAINAGIDPNDVITEETSETTDENAAKTTSIFEQRNIKSAVLVTSSYHMRRALLEFRKDSKGVTVRAHPVAYDKQWSPVWWITPTGWYLAMPELIKSLVLSTGGVSDR